MWSKSLTLQIPQKTYDRVNTVQAALSIAVEEVVQGWGPEV